MTNLITYLHLKLSVQLESRMRDMEAATYCPLFLPKGSEIVKEMLAIGRHYSNMIEKHPEQEIGSPHIWVFNTRSRIGELIPPDQGQTEALRWLRTITESTDLQELATWIKACRHLPTFAKPWKQDRERTIFAVEGLITYKWPKQTRTQRSHPSCRWRSPNKRKKGKRDLNPRLGQARAGLVRSGSRTRKSTAWEPGKGAQQRDHARQRQGKGRKGRKADAPTESVPVVPDGSMGVPYTKAAGKMEGQTAKCL